jgi:hypothetical protein
VGHEFCAGLAHLSFVQIITTVKTLII